MQRLEAAHGEIATKLTRVPPAGPGVFTRPTRTRTAAAATPTVAGLVSALRRRWVPAACVGLLLAAGAAFAAREAFPTGKHTARAQLYVSASAPKVMFDTKEAKSEFNNYLKSQIAMIKSRPVLKAALARPEVAQLATLRAIDSPLEWLEHHLQIDTGVSPELMRVYLSGDSPEDLPVIINAVTEVYLYEIVNKERNERQARLGQLEQSCKKYEDVVRENKQKRKALSERMGSGDPQALAIRERSLAERLAAPEKELLQVQSELRKLEIDATEARAVGGAAEPAVLDADLEAEIDKDAVVTQLLARVAAAEGNIERVRQVVDRDPGDPIFGRYRSELQAARAALTERRKTVRPTVSKQLRDKAKAEAKAGGDALERRIASLKQLEKNLTSEVNRVAGELKELNLSATALEGFKEAILEAEDMSKQLTLEKERRTVEIQAPPRISLWEEAIVTQADNEKKRLAAAGLAGAAALAFVLFAFSWWELHSRRVYGVEEVASGLGMRVMGVLPPYAGRKALVRPSTVAGYPGSQGPFIEAVDSVRTMVAHAAHVDSLRVLMVTSAVQGEGKTLLSGHLAARFAASGRRTLLIDGDLRKPAAHVLFGMPPAPGLAELLRGDVPLEAVIRSVPDSALDLITAGSCDNLATQALAQGRLHAVIEELKDRYELIVIDSSPVLPVPDSLLIGQQVDAVVFAVLRDVSRVPKVNAAVERLEALGVPILGAVVNGGGGEGDGAVYP